MRIVGFGQEVEDDAALDVRLGGSPATTSGASSLLVVDSETRSVVNVGLTASRKLTEKSRAVLPGKGPIANVTGVELPNGTWVVTGNDCDEVDVVDPQGRSNGSTIVALLKGEAFQTVRNVPKEFDREFVSIVGASSTEVVFQNGAKAPRPTGPLTSVR